MLYKRGSGVPRLVIASPPFGVMTWQVRVHRVGGIAFLTLRADGDRMGLQAIFDDEAWLANEVAELGPDPRGHGS